MNYIVTVDGAERLRFEMDPNQAAAPITWDDGDPTPFQTANARHRPAEAAELLNDWLRSQGGEAWGEDEEWEWDETNPETTAEKVAAIMGNDGSVWETNDGRQTLADVCQEHGGTAEQEEHDDPTMVPNRIVFPDGSAICYSDSGWDIEGSRPYLMRGLE